MNLGVPETQGGENRTADCGQRSVAVAWREIGTGQICQSQEEEKMEASTHSMFEPQVAKIKGRCFIEAEDSFMSLYNWL